MMPPLQKLKKTTVDTSFLRTERERLISHLAASPVRGVVGDRLYVVERPLIHSPLFLSAYTRMTIILSIILVLGLGGGTVAAAQNDLPGQALYRVKLISEQMRLRAAGSAEAKTALNLEFASRRAVEAEAVADGKASVSTSTAVFVLTDLKEKLQAANENALAAKAEGKADVLADLGTKVVITARGIDQALDRIQLKISGEIQDASERAEAAAEAAVRSGQSIQVKVDADEDAAVKTQSATSIQASAEGKIGAAENRLEAAVNHVAAIEARFGAEAVAQAKVKLEAARKLIVDAKAKLEAKAYAAAFDLAQQSIQMSNEVNFSLEESIRVLLPMGFSRPQSDTDATVTEKQEQEADDMKSESAVRIETKSSVEANVKL